MSSRFAWSSPPQEFSVYHQIRPDTTLSNGFGGRLGNQWMTSTGELGTTVTLRPGSEDAGNDTPWISGAGEQRYGIGMIVKEDDVLPLFGAFYKVDGVGVAHVHFRRLSSDESPAGLAPKPDSYIFPYRGPCRLNMRSVYFAELAGTPERPLARFEVSPKLIVSLQKELSFTSRLAQTVGPGETLTVRGLETGDHEVVHQIVRIVPPDSKRHLIGWVETEAKPHE